MTGLAGPSARVAGYVAVASFAALIALRGTSVRRPAGEHPAIRVGDAAPVFRLPLLGGGHFAFEPGTVTVIDFWATWCAPCRAELPGIDALSRRFASRGVRFVAVDTEEAEARPAVQALARDLGLSLPIALGGEETAARYRVSVLPTVAVLARDGALFRVLPGVHEPDELAAVIESALAR